MDKSFLASIAVFFILLFFFMVTYKFYPGLKITFNGYLDRDVHGRIHWDFGDGFNELDSIAAKLTAGKSPDNVKLGKVIVEPSGIKTDESRGYLVWLVISKYDYEEKAFDIKGKHHWGEWVDIKSGKKGRQLALFPGSRIVFHCERHLINLKFFKASQAGYARVISDNGPERYYNTYGRNPSWRVTTFTYKNDLKGEIKYIVDPNNNKYLKWLSLPHQKLFRIKFVPNDDELTSIVSGKLKKNGDHFNIHKAIIADPYNKETTFKNDSNNKNKFEISGLDSITQKKFNLLLFKLQIASAALLAFIIYWASQLKVINESKGIIGLLKEIFLKEKRWFFWIVFVFGMGISTAWLVAEWPGCMTPDSIVAHKEAKLLRFTNHHPYIYSFFILSLYNLFNAPLTVILFQIIAYNLLFGYFFYYLYRKDVKLYLVIPLIIIPAFSIPIHLYNLTMWKDIPYSLNILFWAFFLTKFYYQKKYENEDTNINLRDIFILSFLYLSVCTLRHNGIVYVVYIPIALAFIGVLNKRQLVQFAGISALLFFTYFFILPDYVIHKKYRNNNFFNSKIEDTVNEVTQVRKKDYYLEDYLAYRVKRFVATLGVSPKATTWFNDMHHPPQRWFSVDEARSEMKVKPKSGLLSNLTSKLLNTRNFRGYTEGRFIFWNNLFPLIGFCLIFLFYKWLPVSALYSSIFLYQTVFMFFIVWPRWRYLYYLYLGSAFLLPVVTLEMITTKKIRTIALLNKTIKA